MTDIIGYIRPDGDIKETLSEEDPSSIEKDQEWQYRLNDLWTNTKTKQRFLCLGFVLVNEQKARRLMWTPIDIEADKAKKESSD